MNEMKKIFTRILMPLAALPLMAGCIFETFPERSTQTQDQVSSSKTALRAMVNAIPASMMMANSAGYATKYGDHLDFGIAAVHIMTENMLEDLATMGDNPYYNRFAGYASNSYMGKDYVGCAYFWAYYYNWIKMTNDVIRMVDEDAASDEELGYLGIAYAYRAMFYLDLARLYEPKENEYTDVSTVLGLTVPRVDENTSEDETRNNPRVERSVMYGYILDDLAKAEKYLAGRTFSYTSPSLAAVYGMYARAYIEMGAAGEDGAYSRAEHYARLAITESGCTPLTQEEWENPSTGFNSGAACNSWIWGLTLSSSNIGNLLSFTAHMSAEATWGYGPLAHYGASASFYNAISDSDFRKHSWLDPERESFYSYRFAGTAEDKAKFLASAKDYETLKFRPAQGEVSDFAVGSCADHPLMRVEEMYFLEMEAVARQNRLSDAQRLLNDFMEYRIADGSYDCTYRTSTPEAFITEMLFQKRVEFWGEGILFFDYKRLDAGITRSYAGSNHAGVFKLNTTRRSPEWNIVITRGESQSNHAIGDLYNNPDPSGKIPLNQ